jgi:hypothetical protein
MKCRLLNWVTITSEVVTVVLLATGLCHAQTFAVDIPGRDPGVARVKITLESSAAVAGAQLTVPGFNNGNPFGLGGLQSNANGDIVRFQNPNGTNRIVIQYIRNGHFPNFGISSYCGAVPNPENGVSMTLSGVALQNPGYRLNSYSVAKAGGVNGVGVDCSLAKTRVSAGATWSITPPGTNLGRHPLNVVLILDKSGSMLSPVNPLDVDPSHTKWKALQTAVGEFISLWGQDNLNNDNDRIALVFYSTITDPPQNMPGSVNFITRGSGNWPTLTTTVNNTNAGGSTAMGDGVQLAIDGWNALCKNPNSGVDCNFDDVTFVLLTDGLQNTGQPVTPIPNTLNLALNPACGNGGLSPLYECGIPMETEALGTNADHNLVDTIAQQTAGITHQPLTDFTLATAFGDDLVNLLKGNTMSLLDRIEASFNPSVTTPLRQVLLDGSVKRGIFLLGWEGDRNQNALDLQIIPPGGCPGGNSTNCTTVSPVSRSDGPFWTVQSVDLPATGPVGDWNVRVVSRSNLDRPAAVTTGGAVIPYHLSTYSIDGRLSYRLTFTKIGQGTGDSIVMQAEVSYDGKRLTGLGDKIKMHIERPNTGLGTYLHNTSVSDSVLNTEPDPGDVTTPYERKVQFLAKNGTLASTTQPKPIPTDYVLLDNGNSGNGDAKADDGVYSVSIGDTSRPGLYRFKLTMDWDVPTTMRIHRIETLEREVRVNPDSNSSDVSVSRGVNPGEWLINVTPIDRFGNYTGPGFANHFSVDVAGGGSVSGSPSDSKQTGAYVIKLVGVPAGADPNVTIKVDGQVVASGKLTGFNNKKFAIYVDAGLGIPTGTPFSTLFKAGFDLNAGVEYSFNHHVSAEGIFGYHHFPANVGSSLNIYQTSVNAKVYLLPGMLRPFLNAGIGGYFLSPGSTQFGGNTGAGLLFEIPKHPHFGIQGSYNFHAIQTPGSTTKFSTFQGGVRYVF